VDKKDLEVAGVVGVADGVAEEGVAEEEAELRGMEGRVEMPGCGVEVVSIFRGVAFGLGGWGGAFSFSSAWGASFGAACHFSLMLMDRKSSDSPGRGPG
jgi:hypothetical protein